MAQPLDQAFATLSNISISYSDLNHLKNFNVVLLKGYESKLKMWVNWVYTFD